MSRRNQPVVMLKLPCYTSVLARARPALLVVLLWILALPVVSFAQSTEAERHADAVQLLINDAEYENAIARVEAALKKHGKDERLLLQRGLILVNLDRLKDAVSHYRKLMRRFKQNPEPGNNLAMVYRFQQRYGDAIEVFRDTIKRFPEYAAAYENLGDTYLEMAEAEYTAGAKSFPEVESLVSKSRATSRFDELVLGGAVGERERMLEQIREGEQAIAELAAINESAAAQSAALADPSDVILATLESWVNAWSARDIDLYIAHYSLEFDPGNDTNIEEWIAQRRAKIGRATDISVGLDEVKITRTEVNEVIVSFLQHYESDVLKTLARKSLGLRRYDDGKWLITREESRPLE